MSDLQKEIIIKDYIVSWCEVNDFDFNFNGDQWINIIHCIKDYEALYGCRFNSCRVNSDKMRLQEIIEARHKKV